MAEILDGVACFGRLCRLRGNYRKCVVRLAVLCRMLDAGGQCMDLNSVHLSIKKYYSLVELKQRERSSLAEADRYHMNLKTTSSLFDSSMLAHKHM